MKKADRKNDKTAGKTKKARACLKWNKETGTSRDYQKKVLSFGTSKSRDYQKKAHSVLIFHSVHGRHWHNA